MREWLTIIIVLLIVGVLLDGYRRMRQARKSNIRMSLSMQTGAEREDLESYGSELPSGGARVITRDEKAAEALNENVRAAFEASKTTAGRKHYRIPEQVTLNLDESVPMLMESVDAGEAASEAERIEPSLGETALDELDTAPVAEPPPAVEEPPAAQPEAPAVEAEEVLVINVMAPGGERFKGPTLLDAVLSCGLRFGAMNIFHCHEDEQGEGEILFSMANIVVPGTFDLNTMQQFETPGVSLFLTLPLGADSLAAYNRMVATAQALCDDLGGELKDENRSVMTQQTMEHGRQRVQDFERRQLSKG
ncbi:cell division protein ZipA [Exilibacterium tricleocarpae]|uniref:Cell division protein ZipA n=2 Tax=Exilibacterium tricleocarpae TaxID=2591008 RepID=A0A545TM10_9GAMM|nr:cell division protein ZipA [Exilibacterium tricleocarpae]